MMQKNRFSFQIINWFGFFSFVIVAATWFFDISNPLQNSSEGSYFILQYVFFNSLHVPISIVFLLSVPEFSEWVKSKKSRLIDFRYEIVFALICFFVLSYFGDSTISHKVKYFRIDIFFLYFIYLILFSILSSFHTNGHAFGVVSMLNAAKDQTELRTQFIVIEKHLYRIVTVSYCFRLFETLSIALVKDFAQFYPLFFKLNHILLWVSSILIVLNSFFTYKKIDFNKVLFSSRALVWPFVGLVPLAVFFRAANHGIESVWVQSRLINNHPQKMKLYLYVALTMLLWGLLTIPRIYSAKPYLGIETLTVYLALINSVDLFHFWIERNMYLMRDPYTRKQVAPLIKI